MLNSSDIRPLVALLGSLAIHAGLLAMDSGPRPTLLAIRPEQRVTFRLVTRQVEPAVRNRAPANPEVVQQEKPSPPVPSPTANVRKITPSALRRKESEKTPATETTLSSRLHEENISSQTRLPEHAPLKKLALSGEPGSEEIAAVIMAKPIYRQNPPPPYPEKARRRHMEGTVVVEVYVSAAGLVERLEISKSCGHTLLDEAALTAVRKWVFEPGRRDGKAVAMSVLVPVRFTLR